MLSLFFLQHDYAITPADCSACTHILFRFQPLRSRFPDFLLPARLWWPSCRTNCHGLRCRESVTVLAEVFNYALGLLLVIGATESQIWAVVRWSRPRIRGGSEVIDDVSSHEKCRYNGISSPYLQQEQQMSIAIYQYGIPCVQLPG